MPGEDFFFFFLDLNQGFLYSSVPHITMLHSFEVSKAVLYLQSNKICCKVCVGCLCCHFSSENPESEGPEEELCKQREP